MLQRLTGQDLIDAQHRTIDPSRPVLVGVGPVEAATTQAVEAWPSVIWDTNCFYKDMGVGVHASRTEIRRAYQEKGGEDNVRLTMIAGVLLNPARRLAYDLTPLGRLFFDDEIEEAIRIRAATEAAGVRAEGGEVDSAALNDHIDSLRQPVDSLELPEYTDRYPWSYYLLNTECNDVALLSLWRDTITTALWQQYPLDRPQRLAIGFVGGGEEEFRFDRVGYRMVCLIPDHLEFSLEQALRAARLVANTTTHQ